MRDARENKTKPPEIAVPFAYTILKYRRTMGVSYQEVMSMDRAVFDADIQMLNLEQEYNPR